MKQHKKRILRGVDSVKFLSQRKLTRLKKEIDVNRHSISPWKGLLCLNRGTWYCPRFKQMLCVCSSKCEYYAHHAIGARHYKACLFRIEQTPALQRVMENLNTATIIEAFALAQEQSLSKFIRFWDRTEHPIMWSVLPERSYFKHSERRKK
jgi:hypothetical protein